MLQDDHTRQMTAYALFAFLIIFPFALNMWAKRHRRRTRNKTINAIYGYGNTQPLNRFEKLLAWLRII